ncbi:MAG: hypothetical protein ABMA64_32320 [Myxococcota bacterium]
MNRRALLLGAVALGSLGASGRRRYLADHREWTRELKLYEGFSTALLLRATLLEPEFRAILAAERRRLVNPSDADHAEFLARMERDGAAYHEVVFAADSSFDDADRFGDPDLGWGLRLRVDGAEARLVAVDRVRSPSPLHEALYVQHDIWSALWIARFERMSTAPRAIELLVGSGHGNGSVTWALGG